MSALLDEEDPHIDSTHARSSGASKLASYLIVGAVAAAIGVVVTLAVLAALGHAVPAGAPSTGSGKARNLGSATTNPSLVIVLGQNDNLTQPALNTSGLNGVSGMMQIQGWSLEQVTAFYNLSLAHFAAQFGITFTYGAINCLGAPNSIYFSVSDQCNAYLVPITATGKYRVYDISDPESFLPVIIDPLDEPAVQLVEYVVEFDFTPILGASWQFQPFNYGGAYAAANGVPAPVAPSDNLSWGIYKILGQNFFYEITVPNKASLVAAGTSVERGVLCNVNFGSALSVLRVDAFASAPNSQGLYPTSTLGVWAFYNNPAVTAVPSAYTFQPQVGTNGKRYCLPGF